MEVRQRKLNGKGNVNTPVVVCHLGPEMVLK